MAQLMSSARRSLLGATLLGTLLPTTLPANAGASEASLAPAPTSQAAPAVAQQAEAPSLRLAVTRHQLPNGLRVVLNEDHNVPTVSVCVTYDVGSRNEQPGRSGFAHLFEHMMFQGSRNVAKGDHFTWVASRGGSLNGTTSDERTNYYEIVPTGGLQTALWLEADRMKSLAVTRENFENQRKVVQEEYRMRISNAPYAEGLIKLEALSYGDYWPYAHPTIGSMADLDAAQLDWIREFHAAYYAPNNAVVAVSGDLDPQKTLAWITEYFSDAKPTQVPPYLPPPVVHPSPVQSTTDIDANARTPGLYLGYLIPPHRTPAHYALELLLVLLTYGDSSILHHRLVQKEGQLQNIAAWTYDHRGPDLLAIQAVLSDHGKVETVRSAIEEEIARIAELGPTPEQLAKAKQQMQALFVFGLEGTTPRAQYLAQYELFFGDARELATEVQHFNSVSAEQLKTAAREFLTPDAAHAVVVQPAQQ